MQEWLANADEKQLAGAATLATVMFTRMTELASAHVQSKAVIDLLEANDLPAARAMLGQALAAVEEMRSVATSLDELVRTGS